MIRNGKHSDKRSAVCSVYGAKCEPPADWFLDAEYNASLDPLFDTECTTPAELLDDTEYQTPTESFVNTEYKTSTKGSFEIQCW